jgi:hypothetical protein
MAAEDLDDIEILKFTTKKVEPPKAPPIKVPLAGEEYVARCPNDFEFTEILRQLNAINDGEIAEFNIDKMLAPFFSRPDYRKIQILMRGLEPEISLMEDLLPALNALMDFYDPYINDRGKTANREARRAKKAVPRR